MPHFWSHRTLISYLLWPLSVVYMALRFLHRRVRLATQYWPAVPVISVGNITVGGGGKTPVVAWLARHFSEKKLPVAIVLRGYGGAMRDPYQLRGDETAATVGDEALMLWRQLHPLPVSIWVGRNRTAVVKRAEQAGAELIILDDGFQRDDIARAVDIVCIDGGTSTTFGNGFCLPAGPLREPISALKRANFALLFNAPAGNNTWLRVPAYRLRTHVETAALKPFLRQKVVAFAGIARPSKFFASLAAAGVELAEAVSYPDHHVYTLQELAELNAMSHHHNAPLVTTEKDAARLPTSQLGGFATALPLTIDGDDMDNVLAEIEEFLR
ncbi:MAG: tetraacyldisaccharide 4'-kinase [Alphaproteobacteria bacterium]